jgi:PAS domain S-box-containing protein
MKKEILNKRENVAQPDPMAKFSVKDVIAGSEYDWHKSEKSQPAGLEEKLRYQDQTISKLYEAINQSESLFVITDTKSRIEFLNSRFTKLTGYNENELIGKSLHSGINALCNLLENPGIKNALRTNTKWIGEYSLRHRNGERIWLYGSLSPVYGIRNERSFVLVGEDISEIKHMALALTDREEKLRNLIEQLGEGIAIIDLTYDFVFSNNAMTEIFESHHMVDKNLSEFISSPEEMKRIMDVAGKLNPGDRAVLETSVSTATNKKKHVSITITPQTDSKGNGFQGLFCIFKDVSQLKELIEELEAARDDAQKAYHTIGEKNFELQRMNEKLHISETRLSELNAILLEYIKATHK